MDTSLTTQYREQMENDPVFIKYMAEMDKLTDQGVFDRLSALDRMNSADDPPLELYIEGLRLAVEGAEDFISEIERRS